MTVDTVDQQVTTQKPSTDSGPETIRTDTRSVSATGPGGSELSRRIVILVFGIVQLLIGLRFLLLVLDAREANALVSGVLNVSEVFVAPFAGILQNDALHASGSTFDVAAIVAIVGWTILEVVVLKAVGIFRRQQTA